jgi:hypothetical protein
MTSAIDRPRPLDLALSSWHSQGIRFHAPAAGVDIKSVFADCGCFASADVLDLYQHANGFEDGVYCLNQWSLWSIEKIREENEFNPSQDIWFADYLICSHYFCLRAEDSLASSVHVQLYDNSGFQSLKVADSLTQFLQLLLSDPQLVHVFPLG